MVTAISLISQKVGVTWARGLRIRFAWWTSGFEKGKRLCREGIGAGVVIGVAAFQRLA